MQKHFEFIDGLNSERSVRRLARSHAMKGKNTGKKLHRRSRLVNNRLPEFYYSPSSSRKALERAPGSKNDEDTAGLSGEKSETNVSNYTTLGNELLSVTFPVEASSKSLYIINQFFTIVMDAFFPAQLCRLQDSVKSYWLRELFMDRTSTLMAAYHCSMALMATLSDFFFDSVSLSPKAIYHLGQAIALVNQSLQSDKALSDSNLSVVNFLILQGLLRESKSHAQVHLHGLRKMIELRGGLSQLWENDTLSLKIYKTDLDCALHYGTSTCFYRDRMSDIAETLASEGFFISRDLANSGSRFNRLDPFLHQILLDVTNIASLFNLDHVQFRLDPQVLQELIVSVGCRLVRFHTLSEPLLTAKLDSVYHIGLIAFVTTLFIQFGNRRFLKYNLVAQYLRNVIDRGVDEEDNDFMLWLLFIGGISVLQGKDQTYLASRIRQITRSLGIEDWTALHRCLVQFPWINSLYNEAGKALWDSAVGELNTMY